MPRPPVAAIAHSVAARTYGRAASTRASGPPALNSCHFVATPADDRHVGNPTRRWSQPTREELPRRRVRARHLQHRVDRDVERSDECEQHDTRQDRRRRASAGLRLALEPQQQRPGRDDDRGRPDQCTEKWQQGPEAAADQQRDQQHQEHFFFGSGYTPTSRAMRMAMNSCPAIPSSVAAVRARGERHDVAEPRRRQRAEAEVQQVDQLQGFGRAAIREGLRDRAIDDGVEEAPQNSDHQVRGGGAPQPIRRQHLPIEHVAQQQYDGRCIHGCVEPQSQVEQRGIAGVERQPAKCQRGHCQGQHDDERKHRSPDRCNRGEHHQGADQVAHRDAAALAFDEGSERDERQQRDEQIEAAPEEHSAQDVPRGPDRGRIRAAPPVRAREARSCRPAQDAD